MKHKLPKPVEAWAVIDHRDKLIRWAAEGLETWALDDSRKRLSTALQLEGDRIIRVRIVPVKPKPRRVRKEKQP